MAANLKLGTAMRNARLTAAENLIGANGNIAIYSGTTAAACSAANPAGELVEWDFSGPSLFATPANGVMTAESTATGAMSATATAAGAAASFRIFSATGTRDGTTCVMQGTVDESNADLVFNNKTFATGQTIQISAFSLTDGNA
jgi:hypothetical protein